MALTKEAEVKEAIAKLRARFSGDADWARVCDVLDYLVDQRPARSG